jgi:hypothetical protein
MSTQETSDPSETAPAKRQHREGQQDEQQAPTDASLATHTTTWQDLPEDVQSLIFAYAPWAPPTTCKASAATVKDPQLLAQRLAVAKPKKPMALAARHKLWAACQVLLEQRLSSARESELEEVLIRAAACGQDSIVESVMSHLNIMLEDERGGPMQVIITRGAALIAAAACNQVATMPLLLKPFLYWTYIYLAINAAAAHGAVDAVRQLLPFWPSPRSSRWQQWADDHRLLPLILGFCRSMHPSLEVLYIGDAPMTVAAKHGQLDVMRLLARRGADVENCSGTPFAGVKKTTPLEAARAAGQSEAVSWLQRHGATD